MKNLKMVKWIIIPCVLLIVFTSITVSCSLDINDTTKIDSIATSENFEISETESDTDQPIVVTVVPLEVTTNDIVNAYDYDSTKSYLWLQMMAIIKYQNMYVKLTERLDSIDGDGKYFTLSPKYSSDRVKCIYKKEHLDQVMNFTVGQEVTVIGKVTGLVHGITSMFCDIQIEFIVNSSNDTEITEKEYIVEPIISTADEMVKAHDKNVLRATNTYKNRSVKLTGKIFCINYGEKYFCLEAISDNNFLVTIKCCVREEHLNKVMNLKIGQEVTVIGRVTDVRTVIGIFTEVCGDFTENKYTVQVESIK